MNLPVKRAIELDVGLHVSNYSIESILGRGKEGIVYRVRSEKTQNIFALKHYSKTVNTKREIERYLAKFDKLAGVAGVMKVFSVFRLADSSYCSLMELVPGTNLKEVVSRRELEVVEVIKIMSQLIEIIENCHSLKIYVGDLHLENILLSPHGEVKIVDFDIHHRLTRELEVDDIVSVCILFHELTNANSKIISRTFPRRIANVRMRYRTIGELSRTVVENCLKLGVTIPR